MALIRKFREQNFREWLSSKNFATQTFAKRAKIRETFYTFKVVEHKFVLIYAASAGHLAQFKKCRLETAPFNNQN